MSIFLSILIKTEITNNTDEEFIDTLGNFDVWCNCYKSLYNVRHSKVPPSPKDQLEFDTTIDWFQHLDDESTGEYHFAIWRIIRNTGQLVLFGTTESLLNLAHGKGILIFQYRFRTYIHAAMPSRSDQNGNEICLSKVKVKKFMMKKMTTLPQTTILTEVMLLKLNWCHSWK